MIVLFTDFGLQGPYTGQMKAVLYQLAPAVPADLAKLERAIDYMRFIACANVGWGLESTISWAHRRRKAAPQGR